MIQTTLSGGNLPILQSQLLSKEAEIVHFCTMRGGCSGPYSEINLCNYTGDDPMHVQMSRKLFSDELCIPLSRMWFPRQVHGTDVLVVDSSMPDAQEADAVVTNERGLLIGVSTADCVPIILYDNVREVIATAHAGWRGTIGRIVEKTIKKMEASFGCNPVDILAAIGPSISPEAFEVGREVSDIFVREGYADCVVDGYAKPHIDLWQVNKLQMLSAGLKVQNIDCSPICTFRNSEILFSARKLGIKSGRIVSAIMLKSV